MKVRYSAFDADLAARLADFAQLTKLFNQLLITLNGDVDRVLEVMADFQRRRYIPAGVDLEQFRRELEKHIEQLAQVAVARIKGRRTGGQA